MSKKVKRKKPENKKIVKKEVIKKIEYPEVIKRAGYNIIIGKVDDKKLRNELTNTGLIFNVVVSSAETDDDKPNEVVYFKRT